MIPGCFAQNAAEAGRTRFESRCASCHGGDGNGGEHGPAIAGRIAGRDDQQLAAIIHDGFPGGGMPGFSLPDGEVKELIAFLRTLQPLPGQEPVKTTVTVDGAGRVEGYILGQSAEELQLRTPKQIELLRKTATGYRRVTSQTDWPTYHGEFSGNRYSKLKQIDVNNVAKLAPAWIFPVSDGGHLQGTPLVAAGVMYVPMSMNATRSMPAAAGSCGTTAVREPGT